jgi:hypothetical protein
VTDLFDGAYPTPPRQHLTDAQRRRNRQQGLIDSGLHPLSGSNTPIPLLPREQGLTCGTCQHRVKIHGGAKAWPKCELGPATHGEATDVWASWPACTRYEPRKASK